MTSSTTSDTSAGRQLPTRVSNACDRCRRNKSRCDPFRPCSLCVRANTECSFSNNNLPSRVLKRKRMRGLSRECSPEQPLQPSHNEAHSGTEAGAISREESRHPSVVEGEVDSVMGIAQRIYRLGSNPPLKRTTSAIPGGREHPTSLLDRAQRRPVPSILEYSLPSRETMRMLLEEYFNSVHWFSLVIYEPRFRSRFESIQDGHAYPSQKSFLLLLSTVLGMGAWYKSQRTGPDTDNAEEDWRGWSLSLVQGAGSQLTYLMDQSSIASVQACILLGSYYVYHGKPNLSFALLGATIRTAQAIGLHRHPLRGGVSTIEERKRVWWTIYTWDRFASVTYGRPLGINDKDCNVEHPIDTCESPCFNTGDPPGAEISICYSSYQRELNKLYLTASPIIEIIFGMRAVGSNERSAGPQYLAQIMEVTARLWAWRQRLPPHLLLDLSLDCEPNQPHTLKVHRLQALSLQLTFDNLLIIFHRPLLAQQVDHLIRNQPETGQGSAQSPTSLSHVASSSHFGTSVASPLSKSQMSSTEQWWDAALRTSKVTEMPQLAQSATDSHLVAFLAINLFNSAIVMAVLALSDPLSDKAQEVKRTITRIFRLQEVLAKKTQLSMQSNMVLKDVIQMLLRREADAMLAPVVASETDTMKDGELMTTQIELPLMSVEDTLRLPMHLPVGAANNHSRRELSTADKFIRLNESLASVQKIFPVGFDGVYSDGTADHQGWDEVHAPNDMSAGTNDFSTGNYDDWAHNSHETVHADGGSEWAIDDGGIDPTGNGLYWFWDSMWSGT
ncbi:fungal-specific transcription factor domain-containing protein [Pyrenochaeta sp. MPI-SDFR-AT-0127]|nr:fungal-specific transcription factor domain-containing protein [Pyrenochaeta sp. MPI-SDFR-AT-0127]